MFANSQLLVLVTVRAFVLGVLQIHWQSNAKAHIRRRQGDAGMLTDDTVVQNFINSFWLFCAICPPPVRHSQGKALTTEQFDDFRALCDRPLGSGARFGRSFYILVLQLRVAGMVRQITEGFTLIDFFLMYQLDAVLLFL